VGVDVVPEWSTDEDRPAKRHGIEEMVSSRDTSSDTSTDLGDEVHPLWLLWSVTTLEEDEVQSSGALIRREDGAQSSSVLIGESDYAQGGSAQMDWEMKCEVVVHGLTQEKSAHLWCTVRTGR
jgi:hypothetical protein